MYEFSQFYTDPEETLTSLPEWQLLIGENVAATPGAETDDQMVEALRTRMSLQCAIDAYNGDMTKFARLLPDQREHLQEQTQEIGDVEAFGVFLYGLLTHDIGKNDEVRQAVGAGPDVDHDLVYTMLVADPAHLEARQRLMPGFDILPDWGKQALIDLASVNSNYAQTLQGEAPAATLEDLNAVQDPRLIQWDILKAKFDIFGAAGHVNQDVSLTATPATYRRMRNLDLALTDPQLTTAEERNTSFLRREIADFMGVVIPQSHEELQELLALARLECHLRIEDKDSFDALAQDFNQLNQVVKHVLVAELNRSKRATLAYYSPELIRSVAAKEGNGYALQYFAHVLQEAHIADIEARKANLDGISTVLLDEHIRAIKSGEHDTTKDVMRFVPIDNALVAQTRPRGLESLDDLPVFAENGNLQGKKVLFVGEGGGSDGVQAAMLGLMMTDKYGIEVVGVVSSRNTERQVTNGGERIGEATQRVTPDTEAVGDWRFLEKIPLEGERPSPMYILNSSDPTQINSDIQALVDTTGAEVIIGVDTGGDSLYRTLHAGFSARTEADITPDHDYNSLQALNAVADARPELQILSTIVAPGVDSPRYAHEVLQEIDAKRVPLSDDDIALIQHTYTQWRMNGTGSEEGRYGKTPLAWMHALQGNLGVQLLVLPKANVISNDNPWRAFATITPAMAEIVIMDMRRHFAAIRRN